MVKRLLFLTIKQELRSNCENVFGKSISVGPEAPRRKYTQDLDVAEHNGVFWKKARGKEAAGKRLRNAKSEIGEQKAEK